MVLGCVSAEVVDHVPAPVLVVRGRGMGRIVLAWDGSLSASRAADLLPAWPLFAGSAVRVVSVADIEVPWWTGFPEAGSPEYLPMYVDAANASREEHQEIARAMTARLQREGLAAEAEPREGDAATEILAVARMSRANVIVMGTRGRTGLRRLLIGSVARNVLQHAPCSVLIVPDGSEAISGRRDGDR
jgi:nucleotide-binding universal stress UspA family protein